MNKRMKRLAAAVCGLLLAGALRAETVPLFDGSDSYVDLGAPDALQIPSNEPFTVEGWMLFNGTDTRDMLYCKNSNRGSPYTYMLGFANGKLAAFNTDWRGNFVVSRQLGRWYHVAFSFDGSAMSFYLDGALLGTAAFSFVNTAAHTVKIGGYSSSADINGSMSDVRVWNYARSGGEILMDMETRLTGAEAGLIGYWPLDEGEGTTVYDWTASGSDGTLVGAGWNDDGDLTLELPDAEYLDALPVALADLVTGSERFTNSNEVDVVEFPVPRGYDVYQVGTSGGLSEIDPGGWLSTNAFPARLAFDLPAGDTNLVRYVWFTNTAATVRLRRAEAAIRYTRAAPVPVVWPTFQRVIAPPAATVIQPEEIDRLSTGGETGGETMPIFSRWLTLLSGPDGDAAPGEPWITVSSQGVYTVELVVVNAAGTAATSSVCQVELLTVDPSATTFYVDKNWTGSELGTTNAPYRTIRTAVQAANLTTTEPNMIYIAAGWYGDGANGGTEDYSSGGAADGGITVTRRTELYGGYAGWQGGATFDWEARTPRATVIDLEKAGSRAFHCLRSVQSRISVLFDGFTFQNADHAASGGAITVVNGGYGRPVINDCLFTNNVTTGQGGAIYTDIAYEPQTVTACDFIDNRASNGGAIRSGNNTVRLTVEDCLFLRNGATAAGGAIYFNGSNGWQQDVRRCRFEGNTAGTSGGAFFTSDPRVVVEQCALINNAALIGAAAGGQTYHTGAIYLQNCLVTGNTGGYALHVEGHRLFHTYSLDVVHCTVVSNDGGGIHCRGNVETRLGRVVNSIVADNGGYGIHNTDRGYILANNNVTNNALGDYYNVTPDDASISADPRFLDAAGGNYRLAIDSPCIDAGTNLAVTVDLDGVGRPTRYGYDIGCYEERALPVIANRTPVAAGTSAEPRATFVYEDPQTPTYAFFALDTADRGAGAPDGWARFAAAGEQEQGVIFGILFEGLEPETVYWYRCLASNAYDQVWGEAAWFRTAAAGGTNRFWTGDGGNALASNTNNWRDGRAPGAADYVVLDGAAAAITWDAGVDGLTDTVSRWTQLEDYAGTVTFRTVYPGQGDFTNFVISGDAVLANGTWTHVQNSGAQIYRLAVEVGGDFEVAANSRLNAAGLGFYLAGPGYAPLVDGYSYGSAAHGGQGGRQNESYVHATNIYGSVFAPIDLGSGSANPRSRGGGAVLLVVGGILKLEGTITADAQTAYPSGGSVFITAGGLVGSGAIQASNPSSDSYASGGGGRVAVIFAKPEASFADFTGIIRANSINVNANRRGAAGTVYLETASDKPRGGTLVIDNQSQIPTFYTTLPPADGINRENSLALTATGRFKANRHLTLRNLSIATGARLDLAGRQVTVGGALAVAGETDYKPGVYPASAFGAEVEDTADPATGAIIIPSAGTVILLR